MKTKEFRCPRCQGFMVRDVYDELGRFYCLTCGYDAYPQYVPPPPEEKRGQRQRKPSIGGMTL